MAIERELKYQLDEARYERLKTSRYVPQVDAETPVCEWKRIDGIQDVLRPKELAQVTASGGTIAIEEWMGRVVTGDEKA